jgi:hypothetical protein
VKEGVHNSGMENLQAQINELKREVARLRAEITSFGATPSGGGLFGGGGGAPSGGGLFGGGGVAPRGF